MTMQSTGITGKNFGKKLAGVIRSAKTMRDNLQMLILFGMEHYAKTGDTVFLTKCMQACVGVNALPTQKMKQYIQAHANVSWREIEVKAGKKAHVFKKQGKDATYQMPTVKWYDFSTAGDVVADFDTSAAVMNLRKRIDAKLQEGHVKNKTDAKKEIKMLDEMIKVLKIA